MPLAEPLVYFSYGLTKSASTLAYRLAWLSLEQAGCKQPRVPPPFVDAMHSVNFVTRVSDDMMVVLLDIARAQGYPLVVKTHVTPSPAVVRAVNSGAARGSISIRDPRDMALSMLDHGKKARRKGHFAFREYVKLFDTLDAIRLQVDALSEWLKLPGMLPLVYNEIAFDPATVANRLQAHIGIAGNGSEIAAMVADKKYIQFNKGRRDRYKSEMSETDSATFADEFAPLIALIDRAPDIPALPPAAKLRH